MAKVLNLACVTVITGGTGTITLGSAAVNSLTFAQAGAVDGDIVTYAIQDAGTAPTAREIGRATYNAAGPTLSNRTVLKSTNGNAAINVSSSAFAFSTIAAEDVAPAIFSAAPSDAAIRAAHAAAVAAGGGTVMLPATSITLASPLPMASGVKYVGVRPKVTFSPPSGQTIPDRDFSFAGGTVLVGDGTFAAFSVSTTSRGSPDANFFDNAISACGLQDIGFQNFTSALLTGAKNNFSLAYSLFSGLWIKSCTAFGVDVTNFTGCWFGSIFTNGCTHGQRYAASVAFAVFQPCNSIFDQLTDQGPDASLLNRSIVFEGLNGAILDEICARRIQSITFGRGHLSQSATFTNTSSTIAVTDGTKFAVGLPVSFTTSNFGILASNLAPRSVTYIVQSVAGNNITIGLSKSAAAFVASAGGSQTITSWGMPCLELCGADATSVISASRFDDLDLESNSEAVIYVENASVITLDMRQVQNDTAQVGAHIVTRTAAYCNFYCGNGAVTDVDGGSGTTIFSGARGATFQFYGMGVAIDQSRGTRVLSLTGLGPDLESHNTAGASFLSPQIPIAQYANFLVGTGYQISASVAGYLSAATAGATYSLPTIQNTGGAPATANIGLQFVVDNNTSGNVTINTDGSQLLNAVAAVTGVVIPKGQSVRFTAMQGSSFYWLAEQVFKPGIKNVVGDLPAASAALAGFRMLVTDALAPAFNAAVAAGGAVTAPVYCTGTAWNVG